MSDSGELRAPADIKPSDPGAHQLAESSDSDDQFTDAQSGPVSSSSSPVPKTRVEKVDDEPSYGEVPGTEAFKMRDEDARPDEIAIIPDPDASSSASTGTIPATVVEQAPGDQPGPHSADFEDKRKADAEPDVVLKSGDEVEGGSQSDSGSNVLPISPAVPVPTPGRARRKSSRPAPVTAALSRDSGSADGFNDDKNDDEGDDDNDFGDDFDDFEEGAAADDDDFDDFEDGFQHDQPSEVPTPAPVPVQTLPFSIPDFTELAPDEVISTTEPYLSTLFPDSESDLPPLPPLSKEASLFSTPRSASLWSQLVAPPPLAPPDWIRSRTRRLFLVSLGVPVDLDEILPASKQKKLVLPSLNLTSASPRTSSDSRPASRLRQGVEGNASSTSVDTQGKPAPGGSSKVARRRGPPPPPELDLVSARQLCTTTDEALDGMTNEELAAHVAKMESMQGTAKELLEYWQKRTDEKIGDREAFEGVIENLVKHARKVRK